jgi:hypothetical protein
MGRGIDGYQKQSVLGIPDPLTIGAAIYFRVNASSLAAQVLPARILAPKTARKPPIAIPAIRLTLEQRVETLSLGRIIQPHWVGWVCYDSSLDSPFLFLRPNPTRLDNGGASADKDYGRVESKLKLQR